MMIKTNQTREIIRSTAFKRSIKKLLKSGIEFKYNLDNIINLLINNKDIPRQYMDHQLADCKDFKNCRELHVKPDLLLIYRLTNDSVELLELGSHAELFE